MRVRRSLATLALAPLLLAGCQEAEPTPKMPQPTASTSTPSATPTAEEESAEDFIRRWQAAADAMQVTGETTDFREMSPKCRPCQDFADTVQDVYANGGSIQFAGEEIRSIRRTSKTPVTLRVMTLSPPTAITDGDTREVERFPGGETAVEVILMKRASTWTVTHYSVL